ncbi:hypothetical protein RLEG12_24475 [Rhizobium leguminosarum bv. trifolii CB782]|nr:hypothetical protein RLEG12_24475 [Rhizobium leguminosarum bv. trifolii CB782]
MHRPQQADKKTRSAHDRIEEMAAIKTKPLIAGFTLTKVDEEYKLPRGTAGTTLREPNMAGGHAVFSRDDFAELADVLGRIRGRFILSLNAVREVFETFSKFNIEEVDCTYSVAGGGHSKKVMEVIISPPG